MKPSQAQRPVESASNIKPSQDQRPVESASNIDQIADLLSDAEDDVSLAVEDEPEILESKIDDDTDDGATDATDDGDDDDGVTWASALGLDDKDIVLDDEGNVKGFKTKINGKEDTVPLKDLINGFQYSAANTQKAQALAEERKKFDQLTESVTQEYAHRLSQAAKLTDLLADRFLADYNAIDWQRLRLENPGQYAALQQDYATRRAELESVFNAVDSDNKQLLSKQDEEQQAQWHNHLAAQAQSVISNNPEWRDIDKFKAAMTDLQSFVSESYGFTADEFSSVYDARLIELIKDAQKYRAGSRQIQASKVKNLPVFQKSKGPTKQTTQLDKLVNRAKSATGYQKRSAETDAVTALLLGKN